MPELATCEHHTAAIADHESRLRELEAERIKSEVWVGNLRDMFAALKSEVKSLHEAVESLKSSNRTMLALVGVLQVLVIGVVIAMLKARQ